MHMPSAASPHLSPRVVQGGGAAPVPAPAPAAPDTTVAPREVVVLLLVDVAPGSRLWGYARFVLGRWPLRHVAGLRFAKQLGSGFEGGFGLRPSGTRQGLFLVFDGDAQAEAFVQASPLLASYRRHARELCVLKLVATSARGSWSGHGFGIGATARADAPVAALTRASIKPSQALRFWRMAPAAQASLEAAPGCILAVGLGEAPLLRQATFSIWTSVQAMEAYARSGAHLDAIRAAHRGGFFSESAFVRFVPVAVQGRWKGHTLG